MPFVNLMVKARCVTPEEEGQMVAGIQAGAVAAFSSDEPGGAFDPGDVVVHVISTTYASTGAPIFIGMQAKALPKRMANWHERAQAFTASLAPHIPNSLDYEVWVEPVPAATAYGVGRGTLPFVEP